MSQSDELGKLADLHQRGALTDEEFARAKARVLGSSSEPPLGAATAQDAGAAARAPVAGTIQALRRSRDDRWLGGVCGGLGQFTDMPAWVWRLLFVLFVVCMGTGLLVYLLLWIFMPIEPVPVRYAAAPY
jgi:phage shock protein PspC (stress-responsive transcriptional regulator)